MQLVFPCFAEIFFHLFHAAKSASKILQCRRPKCPILLFANVLCRPRPLDPLPFYPGIKARPQAVLCRLFRLFRREEKETARTSCFLLLHKTQLILTARFSPLSRQPEPMTEETAA